MRFLRRTSLLLSFFILGVSSPLSKLHAWISKFWEPIVSNIVQIFPVAKGFFIVNFASTNDRNAILRHGFSWEERFPLMAKPWYKDFDMTSESFNKIPLWVRLPNLPLHFWLDSILEVVGEVLRDLLLVDLASSNVYRTTYVHILVEIDVSKGLLEMIKLACPNGSWIKLLDYEGIPFKCRKCHKIDHLVA